MSKNDASSDLSLTMVDVITNGLAATFVLFFILVVLQEELVWSDATTVTEKRGTLSSREPLVIHITSNENAPLFTEKLESPWEIRPKWKGAMVEVGPGYAILYAETDPPLGTTIHLKLPPKHPPCQIQINHGLRRKAWSLEADRAVPEILWPLPSEAKQP